MTPQQISIGRYKQFQVTLEDSSDNPVTSFTLDNTVQAVYWAGQAQSPNPTITAAWIDPAAGTIRVTFQDTATSGMSPGIYKVEVIVAVPSSVHSGTTSVSGGFFSIELVEVAASEAAPATFSSVRDIRRFAPWIEKDQGKFDLAGFADSRHAGREYIIRYMVSRYLDWAVRRRRNEGWRGDAPTVDEWATLLDDDPTAIVSSDQLVEIEARYAISIILDSAVIAVKTGETNPYSDIAKMMRRRADFLLEGLRIKVVDDSLPGGHCWQDDSTIVWGDVNTLI